MCADKEKDNTTQNNEQDDERPRRNKARPAFEINFFDEEEVDEDELFATDKRAKITMPVPKDSHNNANKNNLHLLPDDFHFSSKQLLRLFLKPKYSVSLSPFSFVPIKLTACQRSKIERSPLHGRPLSMKGQSPNHRIQLNV